MRHTLLLRLQGPMQAWGVQSRFSVRDTTREPTKSGVIGLLCAALGRDRAEPLDDLLALRMGVRVDREGKLMVDFHTALGVVNALGTVGKNAVLSNRYYLADALFLVGLEGEDLALLLGLQAALRRPRYLLSLGRRAFPAGAPIWLQDGLKQGVRLEDALKDFPWLIRRPRSGHSPDQLRYIYETEDGSIGRADAPVSFAERLFAQRRVAMKMGSAPERYYE